MAGIVNVPNGAISDWLERNYQPAKLGNLAFKDAPLTAWLPHDENAGGEMVVLRWKFGFSQGVGATYSQAKTRADASNMKSAKATFDYQTFYSVATVDNPTIERAEGGNLSAVSVLQQSIKDAMEVHGDHLETFLFSDGWPSIGTVATAGISGSTITLSDSSDVEKWEADLEVVSAPTRTSGALNDAGASLVVTKVDRDTNIVTFSAGVAATMPTLAAGHFLFIKSTRVTSAARAALVGILGFIPTSVGGSDAFGDGSLNRSVDPFRLAGARITIPAGTSVVQGLTMFFVRCTKYKIKPDAIFCSFERWGDLIQELGNRVEYIDVENKKYGVTITGVRLFTPKGEVAVIASSKCPYANVWGLTRNSWKLFSVNGPLIRPATRYNKALDSATEDGVEIRYRSFAQLGCLRPHENAIGIFA